MSKDEIWRDVVGYDGRYQVSNKGNVRSIARKDSIGRKCGGLILKPRSFRNGYLHVNLFKDGKVKTKSIHRLVAEAFIPNPNNFPEVNHLDENKINNELSNLEWCDASYNSNYGTRIGRIVQKNSKKVKAVNIKTGEVLTFNSIREAGRKGYAREHVSRASRGIYYGGNLYRGHRWYYIQQEEK